MKYAGVLASASPWRKRIAPLSKALEPAAPDEAHPNVDAGDEQKAPKRGSYRPWAELLKRTFGFDVFSCPHCKGRMKLIAMVTEPRSVARFLRGIGVLAEVPARAPSRGPPYWRSVVLRRKALGDAA